MVDRLRPTGSVPTVNTPTRVRPAKRERHRQNGRGTQSEEKHDKRSLDEQEASNPDQNGSESKKNSAPGRRIDVVI